MKRFGRWWSAVAIVALAGCGGKVANCELQVNGATVCLDSEMSVSFCEHDAGGVATVHDSSDDPTCQDQGYTVECAGTIHEEGSNFSADYHLFYAKSDADCATADGGGFTTVDAG